MKTKTNKTAETQPVAAPVAPVATPVAATVPALYTTFHVAQKFGLRPVELRRVLRSMPNYADGLHTAYRWHTLEDSDETNINGYAGMAVIAKAIGARAGQRAAATARAQAALAQAQALLKAQADAAAAAAAPVAPSKKK